ncbi:BUD13 homolog [Nerophis ophidion]|uniref:BUD13 homolog n=1 Tax=Nerophis ophidion TaxID=159077 RepID=UPI002AE0988D|nr:BUD13 homolog [Nerophis ophidion]XP_061755362.1 BUD13 homolog [Nerophis ophidion]
MRFCEGGGAVVVHDKMASAGLALSKAEYLKRYLSADDDAKKSKDKLKKKRRKPAGKGLKIVDDDIDWKQMVTVEDKQAEDDDEEAPVIAEVIDDRPEEVRRMEVFRTGSRWKVIGEDDGDGPPEEDGDSPARKTRHDSPEASPPGRARHDSPDVSPPRRKRHDSSDQSPPRQQAGKSAKERSKDSSPAKRKQTSSSSRRRSPGGSRPATRRHSDSDQSPPRKRTQKGGASDSDRSPPRKRTQKGGASDSDQSPPRRRAASDDDLSPPRRSGQAEDKRVLSGRRAGLISSDVLRKEKDEERRRDGDNWHLENQSRHAQTVFRDKSGKKRDLESEREEKKRKAAEKAAKDEKYAQWGKGLAQGHMEQQRLEDAVHEAQKPLARRHDDEDLDRMLREQERDGDPMAAMLRRKKERKTHGVKDRVQYKGPPPPPNRFNILPGHRWDGVNRSNGFEQKRYTRISDKKALQEEAYKWSVEDM